MSKYDFSKYKQEVNEINAMCEKLLKNKKIKKVYDKVVKDQEDEIYKINYNRIENMFYKNENKISFDKSLKTNTENKGFSFNVKPRISKGTIC